MKAYQFEHRGKKRMTYSIYVPYMNFVIGFKDYRKRRGVIVSDPITLKQAEQLAKSENAFEINHEQLSAMRYVTNFHNVSNLSQVRLDRDFDFSCESVLGVLTGEHLQEGLARKIWRTINKIPKKFNYVSKIRNDLYKI